MSTIEVRYSDDGDWAEIMADVAGTFAPYTRSRGSNFFDDAATAKNVVIYSRPDDFTYDVPDGALPLGLAAKESA